MNPPKPDPIAAREAQEVNTSQRGARAVDRHERTIKAQAWMSLALMIKDAARELKLRFAVYSKRIRAGAMLYSKAAELYEIQSALLMLLIRLEWASRLPEGVELSTVPFTRGPAGVEWEARARYTPPDREDQPEAGKVILARGATIQEALERLRLHFKSEFGTIPGWPEERDENGIPPLPPPT